MTLKELAQMYGMSVAELCERSGYTRQGLNRILRSDKVTYPGRFRAALLHLLVVSKNIAEEEAAKAKERDRLRFEALDKLATAKGVQWKPNQEPFDDSPEGITGGTTITMNEILDSGFDIGETCEECIRCYGYNNCHEETDDECSQFDEVRSDYSDWKARV
mgnify:FL=1